MKPRTHATAPKLVRLDFADGARLRGKDLRGVRDDDTARLALHVMGPHATWGVAAGLTLELSNPSVVTVAPGAAINCRGEVLLSGARVRLLTPGASLAGRVVEVVAGPGDGPRECGRTRREGCPPYAPALRASAALRWASVGPELCLPDGTRMSPRGRAEVPLGRFRVIDKGTLVAVEPPGRKVARSAAANRVGYGLVSFDALSWSSIPGGWRASVDTSSAGFTTIPAYVVDTVGGAGSPGSMPPFLMVASPSRTGFELAHMSPALASDTSPLLHPTPTGSRLLWLGVEDPRACGRPISYRPMPAPITNSRSGMT